MRFAGVLPLDAAADVVYLVQTAAVQRGCFGDSVEVRVGIVQLVVFRM